MKMELVFINKIKNVNKDFILVINTAAEKNFTGP